MPVLSALPHRRLRRRVETYVDGELPAAQQPQIARHLDECLDCNGHAEMQRLIRACLRRRPNRDPVPLALARLHRFADRLNLTGT